MGQGAHRLKRDEIRTSYQRVVNRENSVVDYITAMKYASNGKAVARGDWPDSEWRVVLIPTTGRFYLVVSNVISSGKSGYSKPVELDARPYSPHMDSLIAEDWYIWGDHTKEAEN